MKKIVLLFLVSMPMHFCYAQYSALLHPVISNLAVDAKNVVTDFSYTLKDHSKVHLKWVVSNIELVEFFSIERSSNGKDFQMIEVFKKLLGNNFDLVDETPLPGRSYYRINTFVRGKPVNSKTLLVYVTADVPVKFYPNPADNLLIIRTDIPVDVQIADATGNVRISQPKVLSLQTINVSNLEKGVYMIRFINRLNNNVIIEKLYKN